MSIDVLLIIFIICNLILWISQFRKDYYIGKIIDGFNKNFESINKTLEMNNTTIAHIIGTIYGDQNGKEKNTH